MGFEVSVTTGGLDRLIAALPKRGAEALEHTGQQLKELISEEIPVRTGSGKASIYLSSTTTGSDYATSVADAQRLNPKVEIVDEVAPNGPDEVIVAVAARHMQFVNDGTVHQSAQPFFDSALALAEDVLAEAFSDLFT